MKKQRSFVVLKLILIMVVLVAAIFCLQKATVKMNAGQRAESLKQLDQSIRKATMTCYATEGVYPPTIEYLEKNYGIQIDRSKFTVFYSVLAKNMMPDITVMENQELVD